MPDLPAGYHLRSFDSIDSTNEEARRLGGDALDRTVIWAKRQTAGRGRRGRAWMSEPGNLFVSLVMRPDVDMLAAAQLSFVAALAVADAVQPLPGRGHVTLKWPNDVLIDGAKVSGILLEGSSAGGVTDGVVIGIGINIASHPPDTPYPATHLSAHRGPDDDDVDSVLERLIGAFEAHYTVWLNNGFEPIRTAWLDRAHRLGEDLDIRTDKETLRGTFVDLDPSGALVLQPSDGTRHLITAGDVFFPEYG